MHLVQLLLPLTDNNKRPFGREAFDQVKDELAQSFGGVTAFRRSPAEGVWRDGGNQTSQDEVVIFEVMCEELDRKWWAGYRTELQERFRQDKLIIRATNFEQL